MNPLARASQRLTPRICRRSIGARVIAGFGLTALLALAVASISLMYNRDAGKSLARVTERDREVSADFREAVVAVEQQSGAVQSFLLSGDDRDLYSLIQGRERFYSAVNRLEQSLPAPERAQGFADIRTHAQEMDDIATYDIAIYRQGWTTTANYLWRRDGRATKDTLLDAVNHQITVHNSAIDTEINGSRDHLRFAFIASLGLVALAELAAFVIGLGITRAITDPVRNLMKVAAGVREGFYDVRAPVTGENELAELTITMNQMVEGLAVSRKQIERALAETAQSEAKYRLLAQRADDIIFTLDRRNVITFVNPAVERTLGYTPEELIGQPVEILYTSETARMVAATGTWVTEQPRTFTGDVELRAKDGSIVTLEVKSSVMMADGRAAGIQGIGRDMTERHRMEQELRRLHTQDRRRVDQLITLNEVGRNIAALQPMDTLLPDLARKIGKTFAYEHVRMLLLDDGNLATAAAWHKDEGDDAALEVMASPLVMRALEGDAGFVAGSGRPEDDAAVRYTEIAVPVRTKSQVLGVLDVRGGAEGGLDESDIFTLQILADQIAVAVENARLFETGQRLAVSEERNRLARDLHDSVTQELFSMTMIAGALPILMQRKPEAALERLGRLHDLARGALAEMRALLFALRPAALEDEGLCAALRKHAAAFEHREGVDVTLDIETDERLPHAVEEALYRVVQEALNNVAKHAQATHVEIQLSREDSSVALTIQDDGLGMDPTADPGPETFGVRGMRERVELLGGVLRINSSPGAGTTVRADVPIPANAAVPA